MICCLNRPFVDTGDNETKIDECLGDLIVKIVDARSGLGFTACRGRLSECRQVGWARTVSAEGDRRWKGVSADRVGWETGDWKGVLMSVPALKSPSS
jgi:hypothetical protein